MPVHMSGGRRRVQVKKEPELKSVVGILVCYFQTPLEAHFYMLYKVAYMYRCRTPPSQNL